VEHARKRLQPATCFDTIVALPIFIEVRSKKTAVHARSGRRNRATSSALERTGLHLSRPEKGEARSRAAGFVVVAKKNGR